MHALNWLMAMRSRIVLTAVPGGFGTAQTAAKLALERVTVISNLDVRHSHGNDYKARLIIESFGSTGRFGHGSQTATIDDALPWSMALGGWCRRWVRVCAEWSAQRGSQLGWFGVYLRSYRHG